MTKKILVLLLTLMMVVGVFALIGAVFNLVFGPLSDLFHRHLFIPNPPISPRPMVFDRFAI